MAHVYRSKLPWLLITVQVVFVVLFATTVRYKGSATGKDPSGGGDVGAYYGMFQDVHVMIFVGFGFLMTFLKRYGYSSVGLNMLVAAFALQWATLIGGYMRSHGTGEVQVGIMTLLTADYAVVTVLITFGALLGKISPLQLILISIIEIVLFSVNEWIGIEMLKAVDIGGSVFVHAFGAYFGLAASWVLRDPEVQKSTKEGAVYHSDIFSMIGTLYLWMFWPSFNSAPAAADDRERAVINTYYALAASCVITFAVSAIVDKKSRFDMVHVQNATLAGGVAVGTSADMMIMPYGALLVGAAAGVLSTLGYKYVTPMLSSKMRIHDTCGVNNLHGMPAIMSAVAGAIAAATATEDVYGFSLYEQFAARAPPMNSTEYLRISEKVHIEPGEGRSRAKQGGFQILVLAITLVIAVVGGLLTGVVLRYVRLLERPKKNSLFDDEKFWNLPGEEDEKDERCELKGKSTYLKRETAQLTVDN